MNDSLDPLLDRGADDIAHTGDIGFEQGVRGVGRIDGHDGSAVDHAITPGQSITDRRYISDVTLRELERAPLPFEDPPRFVGASNECPDSMTGIEQSAHRVRSGQPGRTGHEQAGRFFRHCVH